VKVRVKGAVFSPEHSLENSKAEDSTASAGKSESLWSDTGRLDCRLSAVPYLRLLFSCGHFDEINGPLHFHSHSSPRRGAIRSAHLVAALSRVGT
jgi:hypothetical protein